MSTSSRSTKSSHAGWSPNSFPSGLTNRSSASRRWVQTTPSSASATVFRCVSRGAADRRSWVANSSNGCPGWRHSCLSASRSLLRRDARQANTHGSGTSIRGWKARVCLWRKSMRYRPPTTSRPSSPRCKRWIPRVRLRVAAFRWRSETRRSPTGWRGSPATRELLRSGTARSGHHLGMARLSGTTATSMPATGLSGTDASAR